ILRGSERLLVCIISTVWDSQTVRCTSGVAGAQEVEHLVQPRPVGSGAAGMVDEHLPAAGRGQLIGLQVRLLVGCRDAGLAEQVTHPGNGPKTPGPAMRHAAFGHQSWRVQSGSSRQPAGLSRYVSARYYRACRPPQTGAISSLAAAMGRSVSRTGGR